MKHIKDFKKTDYPVRVIQFGEGGFLRGFADWMLKKMCDCGVFYTSVAVVQPIEKGMCDVLSEQNCLYTHVTRSKNGVEKTVVDIISHCVKPYEDFESYLALADNPDARFIISNTTESGIEFCDSDKQTDTPPKTFPAKLTLLLKRRFDNGLTGFIFLPCELIDKNGECLKNTVLQYAALWEYPDSFKDWIENENVFCNTLVDRINTGYPADESIDLGYTDNMLNTSESFHLWVIETDYDIESELPFSKAGLNVIITKNELEKYRTRKVRILNGAHTSMIPYALLRGKKTVLDCLEDKTVSEHLSACLEEIKESLDIPEKEKNGYANDVLERFANPHIHHLCESIALNSVSKFKVRVLPSITEYKRKTGKTPRRLIFSLAMLIKFYKEGTPVDSENVKEYMKNKSVFEILSDSGLWGVDLSEYAAEVEEYANTSV